MESAPITSLLSSGTTPEDHQLTQGIQTIGNRGFIKTESPALENKVMQELYGNVAKLEGFTNFSEMVETNIDTPTYTPASRIANIVKHPEDNFPGALDKFITGYVIGRGLQPTIRASVAGFNPQQYAPEDIDPTVMLGFFDTAKERSTAVKGLDTLTQGMTPEEKELYEEGIAAGAYFDSNNNNNAPIGNQPINSIRPQ
jgi:hypothetical protein